MLHGITRLKTPASLVRVYENGNFAETRARRAYQKMHGYLPIPGASHRALFDRVATSKQSAFVVKLGTAAAFLELDGTFELRVDLLSVKNASDALLRSLVKTGSKLFGGQWGDEVSASAAMVCGTGIICCDPQTVTATRLTTRDLLEEFVAEADALLKLSKRARVERRASHFGLVCWLTYSLEHLLPAQTFEKVDAMMKSLEKVGHRVPTERDEKRCRDLFRKLRIELQDAI